MAALEKLKKVVPHQMTEEADKKSRPLRDPSSMRDRRTQFEMYFIIFKSFQKLDLLTLKVTCFVMINLKMNCC